MSVSEEPIYDGYTGEEEQIQSVMAIEHIERAAIDVQITTAHQYPRSIQQFKNRALEMVTMDEETAQSCIYRRPVGKEGRKVIYAEGKSVRMAEIVGSCYTNLRVGSMIVELEDRYVKARGMAHDLESNFAASSEVIESFVKKDGTLYSERMKITVAKAALAKARRDATFHVVPGALCKTLEDAARKTAIGTKSTLSQRRTKLLDWINKADIEPDRVYVALGIKGIEDIGLKELEIVTGIKTAIKSGDTTMDEAFPREAIKMPTPKEEPKQTEQPPKPEPKPETRADEGKKSNPALDQWVEAGFSDKEITAKFKILSQLRVEVTDLLAKNHDIKNDSDLARYFGYNTLTASEISPVSYDNILKFIDKVKKGEI